MYFSYEEYVKAVQNVRRSMTIELGKGEYDIAEKLRHKLIQLANTEPEWWDLVTQTF